MVTDRIGYSIFSYTFHYVVILSSVVTAAICVKVLAGKASILTPLQKPTAVGANIAINILIMLTIATLITMNSMIPTVGWDVIDFWAPIAIDIINHQESTTEFFRLESPRSLRHPATMSYILAWSSSATGAFSIPNAGWPWLSMTVSGALIIYGASLSLGNNKFLSKLLFLGAVIMPLASNHSFLAGYAELFVATGLLSGAALISEYLRSGSLSAMIAGLASCLSLMAVKNTGFGYALLPFLALVIVYFYRRSNILLYCLLAAPVLCLLAVALATQNGGVFIVADIGFNFDQTYFSLGGKKLYFTIPDIALLSEIYIASLLKNKSFSIMAITVICCLIATGVQGTKKNPTMLFLSIILASGFLGTSLILFTDYGLAHAVPENDTGNSRLILPIMMHAYLVVAAALAHLPKNQPQVYEEPKN